MVGEPAEAVAGEDSVAQVDDWFDDGPGGPCGGVVFSELIECLADGFWAGVEGAVGGAGVEGGGEGGGVYACLIDEGGEVWVC